MKTRHKITVNAIVFAFFLFWGSGQAAAEILQVSSGYPSIQEAINLAAEGDTVLVEAGTYQEQLVFNGINITVESVSGPEETIVDAGLRGPVVVFDYGNTSTLKGFTLKNGSGTASPYIQGGGVVIYWANPVIENCIISENQGAQGGGVAAIGGGILRRCRIIQNTASIQGGGVFTLPFGDLLVIANTLVADNRSDAVGIEEGAGIHGTVLMTNCAVLNNIGGYGLYNADSSTVTNSIIFGNEGGQIDHTSVTATFSNIQGGYPGEGNIDADPLFLAGDSNYHLAEGSPCIDTGAPVDGLLDDIDGDSRPFGAGVDIGADEYAPSSTAEVNESPVANPGGPYAGIVGSPVVLDGCLSYDTDGDIVVYDWDWDSDGVYDDSSPSCSFSRVWDDPFSGVVTLQVTDDQGATGLSTVEVKVVPAAGGERRIFGILGGFRHCWTPDIDVFTFKGQQGEKITIKLAKDTSKKHSGTRALLVVQDLMHGVCFYRSDNGSLPSEISAKLPKTGRYRIVVMAYPKWLRWGGHTAFEGAYCLSLKSSKDAWKTLADQKVGKK